MILYDETIRQSASDGTPFPKLLESKGVIPGIKVDTGAKPLALAEGETITEGLDGLRERLAEYRELGARFAKWRATYSIAADTPSEYCVWTNAHALARYAALCQEAGIVPIVEPEVLQDGTHTLEQSSKATGRVLQALYTELHDQRVDYRGTLLKPNMVLSGYEASDRAGVDEVAEATLECFYKHVPAAVPGIVFLSGGQTDEDATAHLNAMNARGPASVAALVLVRPGAAGAGAQGVGRQARERRGRAAGLLPPREDERRRPDRHVRARDGARGGCGLAHGPCAGTDPGAEDERDHECETQTRGRRGETDGGRPRDRADITERHHPPESAGRAGRAEGDRDDRPQAKADQGKSAVHRREVRHSDHERVTRRCHHATNGDNSHRPEAPRRRVAGEARHRHRHAEGRHRRGCCSTAGAKTVARVDRAPVSCGALADEGGEPDRAQCQYPTRRQVRHLVRHRRLVRLG